MKPIETLFWLGTAGVLYMTANTIVKNVARDIIHEYPKHDIEKRRAPTMVRSVGPYT